MIEEGASESGSGDDNSSGDGMSHARGRGDHGVTQHVLEVGLSHTCAATPPSVISSAG